MLEEVEYYINYILKEQIEKLGIKNNQIILDSVSTQIYSLLAHWNEIDFRNAILITGLEEGLFYEPKASDLIRSFVVVAIRNSYIESSGSAFYKDYSFEKRIEDSEIKNITFKAINYFKNLDFSLLSSKLELTDEDYYLKISKMYPNSFKVLEMLANMDKNEMYFESFTPTLCSNIFIQGVNTFGNREEKVIEDGYTNNIGLELIKVLQSCLNYHYPFFTSSFKFLSRNYEKLLRVIQFLLENNLSFVSCNYYISNGYLAKRNKLLRAAHGSIESNIKLRDVTGLSKKHAKAINDLRRKKVI
jgi:hypothetical protein